MTAAAGCQVLEDRAVGAIVPLAVGDQLAQRIAQAHQLVDAPVQVGDMLVGQGFHVGAGALAVAHKQVDVATNNTENLDRLKQTAPEKFKDLKVIWKSPLIPGDPIVWRKNLSDATKDKIYDFFMTYGKTPEEAAVLKGLTWAPFRPSSDLQLVPIRQLALFKQMQGVKDNKGLAEPEKTTKVTALQNQLSDLDRLTAALSAMSNVNKAVQ